MSDRALDFLTYMVFDVTRCNGAECSFCVYSDNPCGVTMEEKVVVHCTVNNRKPLKNGIEAKIFKELGEATTPSDIQICVKGIREYFKEDEEAE